MLLNKWIHNHNFSLHKGFESGMLPNPSYVHFQKN
uniref:Uncharacterized protein n=1 Tax=Rhizophora mucronata TaxID=61149 RepID=A0A2P2QLG8_RHIMU